MPSRGQARVRRNPDDFLLACSQLTFGTVPLSEGQAAFRRAWNREIVLLCRGLPASTQTDAMLLFMRHAGLSLDEEMDFFRSYYTPTWSIVYWLLHAGASGQHLTPQDVSDARSAHAMAMYLHALDDHLNDHEMPVTHLALLLRSQAWLVMHNGFARLAEGVDGGDDLVAGFLDDYYASIRGSNAEATLDGFCDLFRRQMATGMIAPVLIARKTGRDEASRGAIQQAYGSFGVAWRLLDDINDIERDLTQGAHSAVYFCLPEDMKALWDAAPAEKGDPRTGRARAICDHVMENHVVDTLRRRIREELGSAAALAARHALAGLAEEFRCLLHPLEEQA